MAKSSCRKESNDKGRAQAARGRMYIHMIILVLLTIGVFVGMALLISHSKHTEAQSTAPPAAQGSVAQPDSNKGFESLKGRWQRPDGGYVLDIKNVDANGKLAAGYFNPRPINVSQAEAALDGATIKVFIELRDVNYPGATYHLTYDLEKDQLRGVYFQPVLQQSFDVVFVRMK